MVKELLLFESLALASSNFSYEQYLLGNGFCRVAGSDEVGRGPLAGPVVAASVVLPVKCDPVPFIDSKKLSHSKRLRLYKLLQDIDADIGVGIVSVKKIDSINILQASLLAMRRSIESLYDQNSNPDFILVDGKFEVPVTIAQKTLIKGESKSASIAAASIVAKVTRDLLMEELHEKFPVYNFKKHKGYPTKYHRAAIAKHGPCEIHRKTFKGVREFVK